MLSLRRKRQARLPALIIDQFIQRHIKHLGDQPALLHIREGLSRLVFGKRLPGHINLLRQFLLRHSTHLPQHHQIILEHVFSPFSLQSHTIL